MLQLMLVLQCRQTLDDRRVACSSSSWWYGLAAGNESTFGNPSLSYRCLPNYLSCPSSDFCRLCRLCRLCHLSLQRAELLERAHSLFDCSFLFDELGDDFIERGGHRGVFVHHELLKDFPLVIPWDPAKEVENVFLLTHLGDCLCTVLLGICVSGRWCCRSCTEILILDFPIDPRCVIVDIYAVL